MQRSYVMEHHRVQIAPNVRMVLPEDPGQQLDFERGGLLVIRRDGDRPVLGSMDDAVRVAVQVIR